jgi:signal transduction histidine kinase
VLGVERVLTGATGRPWQLLATVLGVAVANLVWIALASLLRLQLTATSDGDHKAIRHGQLFANAQVSLDLLLLTAILHFSGGVENPMAVFYVFHVAIGALLLEPWQAILQSAWAVALYAASSIGEGAGWLAHYAFLPEAGPLGLHRQPAYAVLVVGLVACVVFGTLYFTLRIARLLEDHDAQLRSSNAALERSRHAIADLQQRRIRFMQTATHQLKSPFAIIETLANLIREGIVTDPAGIKTTCEKIARRCQDGGTQVAELLTLARVQDVDTARPRGARLDVCEEVRKLSRRYSQVAERKGIELTCWTPSVGELYVALGVQDFQDCLGNLLENAIKYTPSPGRVRVAVTVGREQGQPASVGIHVSDTGIGLDPHLLRSTGRTLGEEPVFEAFRRGANVLAAGIPGTGLGLTIVREVVEQAGGKIWVMSRLGAGSSFTVTFPLAGIEPAEAAGRDTRAAQVRAV